MNKKSQVEKKIRHLDIMLTESEFQMLQDIRNKHKKSVSQLLRESLLYLYLN